MHKIYSMKFSKIYPLLVGKAQRKGREQEEVDTIITWLTGYDVSTIHALADSDITYQEFFDNASLNEKRNLVKGSICGVKIQDIEEQLMKDIRILDKMIDELARGKAMEKILRQ